MQSARPPPLCAGAPWASACGEPLQTLMAPAQLIFLRFWPQHADVGKLLQQGKLIAWRPENNSGMTATASNLLGAS